jgi:hypothetical protein
MISRRSAAITRNVGKWDVQEWEWSSLENC